MNAQFKPFIAQSPVHAFYPIPTGCLEFYDDVAVLDLNGKEVVFTFETEYQDCSFSHHFGIEEQYEINVKIDIEADLSEEFKSYLVECFRADIEKIAYEQAEEQTRQEAEMAEEARAEAMMECDLW